MPAFEHCRCAPEGLRLCIRTVSNGSTHVVRQCQTCGRQVGGPESKKLLLGPDEITALFDTTLEDRYRERVLASLERERVAVPNMPAGPVAQLLAARLEAQQHAAAKIEALAGELVAQLAPAEVADVLTAEAVKIRRELHVNASSRFARLTSEPELKQWLVDHLSEDFELMPEVTGRHLAEGTRVEIDFMAYPKKHLIDAGFVPWHLGIEVKHLNQDDGFSRKASRALWQTVSYTDSEFAVAGRTVRPRFALLFSNLAFEAERALLSNFGRLTENDWVLWRGLLQLANHANVGTLDIKGTVAAWQGWVMRFSGGTYFQRRHGGRWRDTLYRESNRNLVEKIRIGNF